MNKLLNNLLGMYKQAKMKKSAMIIDEILDRKNGASYNPQDFYDYVSQQLDVLNSKDIATALDSGTEEDVKKALCEYIKLGEYNPAICDYINSVNWLEEEDVEKWFSIKLSDEQAKEFTKLLTENNIKNKSKKEGEEIRVSFFLLPSSIGVAQGLLSATLSKFPDKQAKLNKKAEEDLIEVGWGLYTNDEYEIKENALYGGGEIKEVNKSFWDKINKDIEKVEMWFLKDGYKQFFAKVRDEGHGKDSELGGTAWMTKQQIQDFIDRAERTDSNRYTIREEIGGINVPFDYDETLFFTLDIIVDEETLDDLNIESKRVSKNKKFSSKNTKLTKKAGWKVLTPKDLTEEVKDEFLKDSIKEYAGHVKREDFYFVKGIKEKEDDQFSYEWEEGMFGEWRTNVKGEKWYSLTDLGDDWDYIYLIKEDKLYKMPNRESLTDFGVVSSKRVKLTKKADYTKEEIEMINKEKEKQIECGEMIWKAKNALYGNKVQECKEVVKQMPENCKLNFVVNVKREGEDKYYKKEINEIFKVIPQSLINEADEILKENPNTLYVSEWYRKSSKTNRLHKKSETFDVAEEFAKKIVEDNKHAFSGHTDMAKLENNAYSMFLMDNASIKEILDEAKKIVSELDNDKDKNLEDADLYFGMKDRALLAEKVLEEKTKQEKQSSKAKLVRKQAENKEIVVTYEGTNGKEYIVKAPNGLYFNEYVDTDTQYSRGAGPFETLEKAKEMFKKHRPSAKEVVATKKKAGIDPNVSAEEIVKLNFDMPIEKADKVKEQFNEKGIKYQSRKGKYTVEFSVDIEASKVDLVYEIIRNIKKLSSTKKQATIKHENGVYNVYSESGKCLGKGYKTKEEAEKRLKQVEYFKNKKSSLSTKPYFQTSKEMVKDALDLWHSRQNLYNKKYNTDEELGEAEIEQKNKEYNFLIKWNYEYGDFMNTNNDILYKLITNQISIEQAVEKINAFFEQVYNYDPLNPHKKKASFPNKRTSLKQVVISKMAKIKK